MARTPTLIEADLRDCNRAIAMAMPSDPEWDWIVRRRNELLIEREQAENPVYRQKCEVITIQSKINQTP